jgi:aryl-alcohol dehydrogenase-like predicted oxidoreductase
MEYIDFGNTGLRVSRLCIGTGTHGWAGRSEQTALGLGGLADLLRISWDHGINFWDSADQYGSHRHIARALQGIPRDQVVVMTKTSARRGRQVKQDVRRFLRELETDVLDIVLLHFVSQPDWPRVYAGAMKALSEAKEQGKVRAVGLSSHNLGVLRAAAQSEWVDVVLARINYAGVDMDAPPADVTPVLKTLHEAGKAVCAMKVLGCGKLVNDVEGAIEYVLQLGTVHAMTIGTSSRAQLQQNLGVMEALAHRYPAAKELGDQY